MIEYLQMIQNTISRMSTSSALFKGFTATIVAGLVVITSNRTSVIEFLVPILCIMGFISMDVYYLQLERRFRFLYEEVRCGTHPIDFSINPPSVKEIKAKDPENNSKVKLPSCIFTKPILWFYIPVIIGCGILMKCKLSL